MNRARLHFRLVAGVFAAALVLGACGGGSDGGGGDPAAGEIPENEQPTDENTDAATSGKCGGSGGEAVKLVASQFQFQPSELAAAAGEQVTVEFTNDDDVPHTFTITDLECDTGSVAGGDTAKLSFTMPDSDMPFVCVIHPDMQGTLTPQ
ncbi:MAG: cupredoxin domain-containing protein [Actinomycetota bacterium]|nr:cupredoxin domain-containing protein [Actinomycetota bacterium]